MTNYEHLIEYISILSHLIERWTNYLKNDIYFEIHLFAIIVTGQKM